MLARSEGSQGVWGSSEWVIRAMGKAPDTSFVSGETYTHAWHVIYMVNI